MANLNVQGFFVDNVMVKGNKLIIILKGEKDEIRAGAGDIGSVVQSLELHATAGEDAVINATLLRNEREFETYQHPSGRDPGGARSRPRSMGALISPDSCRGAIPPD